MSDDLVKPEFTVDGLPCKSKNDLVTAGVGLPRHLQYTVKMRVNEHREAAVRRHQKFAAACARGEFRVGDYSNPLHHALWLLA